METIAVVVVVFYLQVNTIIQYKRRIIRLPEKRITPIKAGHIK